MKTSNIIKKQNFLSSKVVKSHIKTYVVIFSVPILISIILFVYASNMLREEIDNVNYALLKNVSSKISVQLSFMDDIILLHMYNPNILSLLRNDTGTSEYILKRKEISDTLITSTTSHSVIKEFYIYSTRQKYALGQGYASDYDIFTGQKLKSYGIDLENYHAFFSRHNYRQFYYFKQSNNTVLPVYLNSTPHGSSRPVLGNFFFIINQQMLEYEFSNLNSYENGHLYVLSPDYHLIASSNNNLDPYLPIITNPDNHSSPSLKIQTNGNDYIMINHTDPQTEWHYVATIPYGDFYRKSNIIQILSMISIVLCLGIEITLIFYFARLNYKPLSNIISLIKNTSQNDENLDEFQLIHQSIQNVLDNKESSQISLENNKLSLKQLTLQSLLHKRITNYHQTDHQLNEYGISFPHKIFQVVYLVVEEEGDLRDLSFKTSQKKELAPIPFVINNILEDIMQTAFSVVTEDKESICIIVNMQKSDFDITRPISELFSILSDNLNMTLSAFINEPVYELDRIHKGYSQCVELYKHYDVNSNETIFYYKDINTKDISSVFPDKSRHKLKKLLLEHKYENASTFLSEFIDEHQPNSTLAIRYFAFSLAEIFIKTARSLNYITYDHGEFMEYINNIITSETIGHLKDYINDCVDLMKDYSINEGNESSDEASITQKSIAIINEYLNNNQLNVSFVANNLDVSQSSLSRVFKKKTGIGMLDYISNKRIELVKNRLVESSDSITSISQQIGFSSVNTMIRTFKRVVGVSPNTYRSVFNELIDD